MPFAKSCRVGWRAGYLAAPLALIFTVSANAQLAAPDFPIEAGLRRTIAIEGSGDQRFGLAERMAHYKVPGVSFAVIEGCRIVDARGFGRHAVGGEAVTPETLFQAGSMSKSVTAIAALRLVDQGKLALDTDADTLLKDWSFPETPLLTTERVTLRRLLGHTAGTNIEGMLGYMPGAALPSMTQILNGQAPANTPGIIVQKVPGSAWDYSGGGYIVIQKLMEDSASEPFPDLIDRLVLDPMGMTSSNFRHPVRGDGARRAEGTAADGSALPGNWRLYPEMAAAGLWTTPSDVARFAIRTAHAVRGEDHSILSNEATAQLMTRGLGNWGLGVDLGPPDSPRQFSHTGKNIGFTSMFIMYPDSCQGAVVMTNGYDGGWLINEVIRSIADAYHWPARKPAPVQAAVPLTDAIAQRFVGAYRLRDFPSERFVISRTPGGSLYWARAGFVGRDLFPQSDGKLFSPDSVMTLEARDREVVRAQTLKLSFGGGINIAERID